MSNKIKQELNKIDIPKELSERSKRGISKAKKERQGDTINLKIRAFLGVAILLVSIGAFSLINRNFNQDNTNNTQNIIVAEDGSVFIPAIKLPESSENADMIGLIVFNGKIYTQTRTEIDSNAAKEILGEKLGTTKGTIDEWSTQDAYAEEFASTIGEVDVYSVEGYSKDFRIMAYTERDGELYAEFFENLNGITISSGKDVFGKLNMIGNISNAHFRTYEDWNNSIENFHHISNTAVIMEFVENLNNVKPLPRSQNSDPISHSRNNEDFKELRIQLIDGSTVKLTLLKDGYIYYGHMGVYFEMNKDLFAKIWKELE